MGEKVTKIYGINSITLLKCEKGRIALRIAFLTLGCKVNFYETEKMKEQFMYKGHTVVSFEEQADVYIINTCTVTNIADRKSRKMLHRARRMNGDALVVATGCYVNSSTRNPELDAGVDVFVENEEKQWLADIVEEVMQSREDLSQSEDVLPDGNMSEAARDELHTRAYIKVQDGCNQYCTYCIIPYVRGKLKSRTQDDVVAEVEKIAEKGIQEIVLTGIHLSSYGLDLTDKRSFLELDGKPLLALIEAVSQVTGIVRIRLGSLEPRVITEDFVKALADIDKVCPHFHLSLQSGCDETLRRMNRHYTVDEYLEKLDIIRKYYEYPAITTDIIVGFPGETEEEFDATCSFVRKAKFAQIHVFKYSRRRGTMAAAMEGQVPDEIKARRSSRLLMVGRELDWLYCSHFIGEKTDVLLEEVINTPIGNCVVGHNERYVRVRIFVRDREKAEKMCNHLVTVRINSKENGGDCRGSISPS